MSELIGCLVKYLRQDVVTSWYSVGVEQRLVFSLGISGLLGPDVPLLVRNTHQAEQQDQYHFHLGKSIL